MKLLKRLFGYAEAQRALAREINWANVYHDSIRGKAWLQELPLNIGRWAGNYTFFYLLNRILADYRPERILELGLGESSKFISTTIQHDLRESEHCVIEHNPDWKAAFSQRFTLGNRSKIELLPLSSRRVDQHEYNHYEGIEELAANWLPDLVIVDGPIGTPHFSRYDMVLIGESLRKKEEFLFLIDDHERAGEKRSAKALVELLRSQDREVHSHEYCGVANVFVIATDKYKYAISL
ncbi:MAG: hypothetical protein AAF802_02545 [Planctomycetota bacterium]